MKGEIFLSGKSDPGKGSPLISVIVPVYNVRPYLEEALESVIHQTYRNLDIILIDDGSEDGSGEICDRYAKTDPRTRVIHQRNQGLSAARNTGLDAIRGEYVSFLDSDDAFRPEMIETLWKALAREQADMVLCKIALCYTQQRLSRAKARRTEPGFRPGVYDRKAFLRTMVDERPNVYVWNKLYRAELWQNIRFPVGRVFEDVAVAFPIAGRAERVCVLPDVLYLYRRHYKSISLTPSLQSFRDWLANYREYDAFVEENIPEIFDEEHLRKLHQHKMIQYLWEYASLPLGEMKTDEVEYLRKLILDLGKQTGGHGCGFPTWFAWKLFRISPRLIRILCPVYYKTYIKLQEIRCR